jgi:hypothetical protein
MVRFLDKAGAEFQLQPICVRPSDDCDPAVECLRLDTVNADVIAGKPGA